MNAQDALASALHDYACEYKDRTWDKCRHPHPAEAAALTASGWALAPVGTEDDLPNGVPCRCVLLAGRCGCPCHADDAQPAPDPLLDVERLAKVLDKYVMPLRGLYIPVEDIAREYGAALAAPARPPGRGAVTRCATCRRWIWPL